MEEYRQPGQGSQKGLILAIVFSALVVSGSLFFLGLQMGGSKMAANVVANNAPAAAVPSPVAPANPTITASLDELVDDDPFMGDDDAPVTIIEWTDYQCPFCGRHSTQTLPSIKKEYIDTGKVKYVLRDLALSFHPNALPGAKAANCAGEQDKYWEMHDLIFANQTALSPESLEKWADELGLNRSKYDACVDSDKYDKEAAADQAAGASWGITGTPGFVISNGETSKKISGAQPFTNFKQEIEALLN